MQELSLDYFKLPSEQKYHIYRIAGSEVNEHMTDKTDQRTGKYYHLHDY